MFILFQLLEVLSTILIYFGITVLNILSGAHVLKSVCHWKIGPRNFPLNFGPGDQFFHGKLVSRTIFPEKIVLGPIFHSKMFHCRTNFHEKNGPRSNFPGILVRGDHCFSGKFGPPLKNLVLQLQDQNFQGRTKFP